jgi:hypothetical protein
MRNWAGRAAGSSNAQRRRRTCASLAAFPWSLEAASAAQDSAGAFRAGEGGGGGVGGTFERMRLSARRRPQCHFRRAGLSVNLTSWSMTWKTMTVRVRVAHRHMLTASLCTQFMRAALGPCSCSILRLQALKCLSRAMVGHTPSTLKPTALFLTTCTSTPFACRRALGARCACLGLVSFARGEARSSPANTS